MPAPLLTERLQQVSQALQIAELEFAPFGIVNRLNGEAVQSLYDIPISSLEHAHMISYSGISQSAKGERVSSENWSQLLPAREFAGHGMPSAYAIAGFCLQKSVQQVFIQQGWSDKSGIAYQKEDGQVKVLDSGFGSGFMAMSNIIQKSAEAVTAAEPDQLSLDTLQKYVNKALGQIAIPLADLPNRINRLVEVLYGIRVIGYYDASSAAYELGLGYDTDLTPYKIIADSSKVPNLANWQQTHDVVARFATTDRCAALGSHAFNDVWRALLKNAVRIPELFAVTLNG